MKKSSIFSSLKNAKTSVDVSGLPGPGKDSVDKGSPKWSISEYAGHVLRIFFTRLILFLIPCVLILDSLWTWSNQISSLEVELNNFLQQQYRYLQTYDYRAISSHVEALAISEDFRHIKMVDGYGSIIREIGVSTGVRSEIDGPNKSWWDSALVSLVKRLEMPDNTVASIYVEISLFSVLKPSLIRAALSLILLLLFFACIVGGMKSVTRRLENALLYLTNKIEQAESYDDFMMLDQVEVPFREYSSFISKCIGLTKKLQALQEKEREYDKSQMAMKTAQMFAHDARKPFALVQLAIDLMERTEDTEKLKIYISQLSPEIKKAASAVDGMIEDLMEVGTKKPPQVAEVSPVKLLEGALTSAQVHFGQYYIDTSYDLQHRSNLLVDRLKVMRVISNILDNAIQCCEIPGRIWIRTLEHAGLIVFTIGNSGSFVMEENRLRIFEMFFSHDKIAGTGLGLAIAKKIVLAHGGEIWCTSDQELGTEFHFTLPCGVSLDADITSPLPAFKMEGIIIGD